MTRCTFCGAYGDGEPPLHHTIRTDGTLTCPRAVDRGRIDDLFRQLYEVTK